MSTQKPIKLKPIQRRQQILALQTAGFTQHEMAAQLGVSRSTIQDDLDALAPSKSLAVAQLDALNAAISKTLSVESRADQYVKLATKAKNEAVSLGALQRIDDLDGIVTEKERIRAKGAANSEVQPMFVLPQGCNLNVTVNRNTMNVSPHDTPVSHDDTVNIDTPTPSKRDA